MKSNLGVSVALLGCIIYCCGIFSGYTALILIGGYVLIVEKNDWLRYVAVKALVLSIAFSALYFLIGIIPDVIGVVQDFVAIFTSDYFTYYTIMKIETVLYGIVAIVKTLLFLLLALKALSMNDVSVPVVDKLLSKHE